MEENVIVAMNNDLVIEMKPEVDWVTASFTDITGIAYNKNDLENAIVFRSGGGGGGGLFVANWDTNTGALDKTAGELIEAHENGKHLVVSPSLGEGVEGFAHIDVFEVQHTTYMSGDEEINYYGFAIYATNVSQVVRFEASSADDYPLN